MRYLSFRIVLLGLFTITVSCHKDKSDDLSKQNGQWIWWVEDGKSDGEWVPADEFGKRKLLNGYYIHWHPNGNKEGEGYLKNGLKQGKWNFWFENGLIEKDHYYIDDTLHGKITGHYYKNDTLLKVVRIYDMGVMDGICYTYYDNGNLYLVGTYKKGIREGKIILYYYDGQIKTEGLYENDLATDTSRSYYPNGVLYQLIIRKDGLFIDTVRTYYDNGVLMYKEPYKLGLRHGKAFEYYPNGKLKSITCRKEDKQDGEWILYDSLGNISIIEKYQDGIFIKYLQ
jgi:antitoxin component YwqK of YwqJK toxin-antitoxin module